MSAILNNDHIAKFNQDGAILIKGKFDNHWIKILKQGFEKAKSNQAQDLQITPKVQIYLNI